MEFRWVAAIALWSMLIGPVLGPPLPTPVPCESASARAPAVSKPAKAAVSTPRLDRR